MTKSNGTNPTGNPFFDFDPTRVMDEIGFGALDMEAVLACHRKNVEAAMEAGKLAFEGVQAVLSRQADIVRQSIEDAGRVMEEVNDAPTPAERIARQTDAAKAAFERSLANAQELREIVVKSNAEAADVISRRVVESFDDVKALLTGAKR